MWQNRIDSQFESLKEAFPAAKLTQDRKFVRIPSLLLPEKFNMKSTPVLISLAKEYELFGFPAVYVSRNLRIRRHGTFVKSRHLDENLTETEMLGNNFVKLCWYNPPRFKNLRELLANVILYLERIRE